MNHLNRLRAPLFAALLPLALAACSSAPNDADVEKALKTGMQNAMKQAQDKGGEMAGKMVAAIMSQVEIKSVKVQSCTKDSDGKGYDCTVDMDVKTPMAGEQKTTKQLHLVQGKDGWKITQ